LTDAAPEAVTLNFEMACTPADFHRLLPAVAAVEYDAVRDQFSHEEDGRRWRLRLIEPRERSVGALRLPVVDVELVFEGYALGDIDAVVRRFFAHFRRGGG
jgi:hypothetical protein